MASPSAVLDEFRRASSVTLTYLLRGHAAERPDAVALKGPDRVLTYRQLESSVSRLASVLRDRGVRPGDRVAIYLRHRLEMAEAIMACSWCGAITVPINSRLAAPEIAHILANSEAKRAVTEQALMPIFREASDGMATAELPIVLESGDGDDYGGLISGHDEPMAMVEVDDSDTAFILYTSGTTGRPKGAVTTYRNMIVNTMMVTSLRRIQPGDEVGLCSLPLFHAGGLSAYMPLLLMGGTAIFPPITAFGGEEVAELLAEERVTHLLMVPTQLAELCEAVGPDHSLSLRRIVWSAQKAPQAVLEAIHRTFPGIDIYCSFGQTETLVALQLDRDDAERKMGSIGKPLPHVRLRIVDASGDDVKDGEVGELIVRSPSVCDGYWRNELETERAFADGWFHTGDLCRRDEEGFLYIVDRAKDVIISGGENVYSAEVEAVLLAHPGIAEAAVIGRSHPKWGETPIAIVVAAEPGAVLSEQEIREHCRTRLAAFKCPTAVIALESLPRNALGKVVKPVLREQYGAASA